MVFWGAFWGKEFYSLIKVFVEEDLCLLPICSLVISFDIYYSKYYLL